MAPQITEYNAKVSDLRPDEMGPGALRQTGQTEKSNANQTGSIISRDFSSFGDMIQRHQDLAKQNELQTGAAAFAMEDLSFTQDWENALGSDDPAKQQAVIDAHNAKLDTLVGSAQSPEAKAQFATEAARQRTAHFNSTTADRAQQAGADAVTNVNTFSAAQVGIVSIDPTRADDVRAHVADQIEGMVPAGADPATRDASVKKYTLQVQQAVSNAALKSAINKNPGAVLQQYNAGGFDALVKSGQMDANDYNGIPSAVQTEIDRQRNQKNADGQTQAQVDRAAYDKVTTDTIASSIQPDGSSALPPNFFSRLGPTGDIGIAAAKISGGASELATLQQWGQKVLSDKQNPQATDPAVYARLKAAVVTGQLTGQSGELAIINQFNGSGAGKNDGGLSQADTNSLISDIQTHDAKKIADPGETSREDAGLANAGNIFEPKKNALGTYFVDPNTGQDITDAAKVAAVNQQQFTSQAYKTWINNHADDYLKSPSNPDGIPWQRLYDPTSPDFIGLKWPGLTADERVSLQKQQAQQPLAAPAGVPAPPGASVAGAKPRAVDADGKSVDPNDKAAAATYFR